MNPYFEVRPEVADLLRRHGLTDFALLDAAQSFSEHNSRWRRHVRAFQRWLSRGRWGTMDYLMRHEEVRAEPGRLLAGLSSSFVFLIPYAVGQSIRGAEAAPQAAPQTSPLLDEGPGGLLQRIARYARHRDYHRVILKRLTAAFEELKTGASDSTPFEFRVIVDSVPFLDRAHAHLGGLGFFGKNTLLIRPGLGSYFFIASVLCTAPARRFGQPLEQDAARDRLAELGCGSCQKCVDACPTGALLGDYTMDAEKCFSYASIEHRGLLPESMVEPFKNLFFGCDICQEVCPYNFRTRDGRRWPEFLTPDERLRSLTLRQVSVMSRADYEAWFGGLPLTRAKYPGLVRNSLYALYASGDRSGLDHAILHWQNLGSFGETSECPHEILSTVHQLETLQRGRTS